MTKEQVIKLIKDQQSLYLGEARISRDKIANRMKSATAQQIMQETIFMQDMESRAYAMKLLLEDIEDIEINELAEEL